MTAYRTALARPQHLSWYRGLLSALFLALFFPPGGVVDIQAAQPVQPAGVQAGKNWRFRVYADSLPDVDDLSVGPDGSVYATQELGSRKGRVVRLRNGRAEVVADNLDHPGGVLAKGRYLYISEQVSDGRVTRIHLAEDGKRRVFDGLQNPQHMAVLADGDVVVAEDVLNGRLTRLSADGRLEVIASGFNGLEGLAVARDGTVYIGETGTGRVLSYRNGTLNVVVDDLDAPAQLEYAADGSLWITDDGESGRLLRFKDGVLETVVRGLATPRGIAVAEDGSVLVAERGRSRILAVDSKP